MDPQALMQMMLAAQGGGGGIDSASLLQQLASTADDPTTRMLGAMMASRQAASQSEEEEDEDDEEAEERQRRENELVTRLEQVQDVLRRTYEELEATRARNQLLAEALGACARCWGADAQCEICRGAGRSAWAAPNPALFGRFVVPALRRVAEARKNAERDAGGARRRPNEKDPA